MQIASSDDRNAWMAMGAAAKIMRLPMAIIAL